jgi:hypothetical protein
MRSGKHEHQHTSGNILTKSSAICLLTFIPSFALLLVPTIINNAVPVIGIIFLFLSFAFSGFLLAHEKKCGCRNSGLSGTAAHFIIDLFLGLLLLLSTILTWASFGHYDPAPTIVGTYGTVGLIINWQVLPLFQPVELCVNHAQCCAHLPCPATARGGASRNYGFVPVVVSSVHK